MRRLIVFLSLFMILTSFLAFAENKPQQKIPDTPAQEIAPAKKKFIIRMKDGGSMETTNYTYDNGKVKVILKDGSISFDKSMVLKIEEVKGEDDGTVQKVFKLPSSETGSAAPAQKQAPAQSQPANPMKREYSEPQAQTDDNGHTELWWKGLVNQWKKKLAEAQKRYAKAQEDWNKYNGLVSTLPAGNTANPTATDFQATQYQDLRGAARVSMDQAQADMDDAKRMLEEGLPDEARRAGAPPGWAR